MKNRYADWYDLCLGEMTYDVEYLKKFCALCPEGMILEPGSGTGRLMPHIRRPERRFMELSAEMTEVFLARHPEEKSNLLAGSADKIPLPDESVTGIYVPFNGIGELFPTAFSLKEFHRVLRQDGKLLICAANPAFPMLRELIGIDKDKRFQYTIRTLRAPKNEYSWQTTLSVRENTPAPKEHQFFINQYLIPRTKLEELCRESGFRTDMAHGNYDGCAWAENSPWTLLTLSKIPAGTRTISPDIAKLTAVYDSVADKYDSFAAGGRYIGPGWLKQKLSGLNFLKPNILDLGCANGYLGRAAKEVFANCSLFGVDVSGGMIEELKKAGLYENAIIWDLNAGIPFIEAEVFDIVFALGVFEFIKDPLPVLQGITGAMELHGRLFVSFECFDPAKNPDRTVTDPRIGFPRYLRALEEIRALLAKAKLEIVSCEKQTAYKSPSTGAEVEYFMCEIKRDRNL
ncbi:MAG: methyltransferase domain-containing protein [Elusimicrobia bacterium]|nr:methyltransferase domain-containing protein [Elusimicrobiota bacterium]